MLVKKIVCVFINNCDIVKKITPKPPPHEFPLTKAQQSFFDIKYYIYIYNIQMKLLFSRSFFLSLYMYSK